MSAPAPVPVPVPAPAPSAVAVPAPAAVAVARYTGRALDVSSAPPGPPVHSFAYQGLEESFHTYNPLPDGQAYISANGATYHARYSCAKFSSAANAFFLIDLAACKPNKKIKACPHCPRDKDPKAYVTALRQKIASAQKAHVRHQRDTDRGSAAKTAALAQIGDKRRREIEHKVLTNEIFLSKRAKTDLGAYTTAAERSIIADTVAAMSDEQKKARHIAYQKKRLEGHPGIREHENANARDRYAQRMADDPAFAETKREASRRAEASDARKAWKAAWIAQNTDKVRAYYSKHNALPARKEQNAQRERTPLAREVRKAYRDSHKEEAAEWRKGYVKTLEYRYCTMKGNARDNDHAMLFESFDEFKQKYDDADYACAYCGIEAEETPLGLDRVDNAGPYSPDNTVVSCYVCNRMKWTDTLDDFHVAVRNVCAHNQLCDGVESNYTSFASAMSGYIWSGHCYQAKDRGLVNDITKEQFDDLHAPDSRCAYCGIGSDLVRLGVDRVDNKVGYTLENSVSCCSRCNFMKVNSTREDFLQQCLRIHSNRP
jgi:hypothetical protein